MRSHLLSLLLCCISAELSSAAKDCSSKMPGDFAYEACGGFCKIDKKANHCRYCKCRECSFCKGAETVAPAPPKQQHGGDAAHRNKKRLDAVTGKASKAGKADGAAKNAPVVAASPVMDAGTTVTRKRCASGIRGDYAYETCGAVRRLKWKLNSGRGSVPSPQARGFVIWSW